MKTSTNYSMRTKWSDTMYGKILLNRLDKWVNATTVWLRH